MSREITAAASLGRIEINTFDTISPRTFFFNRCSALLLPWCELKIGLMTQVKPEGKALRVWDRNLPLSHRRLFQKLSHLYVPNYIILVRPLTLSTWPWTTRRDRGRDQHSSQTTQPFQPIWRSVIVDMILWEMMTYRVAPERFGDNVILCCNFFWGQWSLQPRRSTCAMNIHRYTHIIILTIF